MKKPSRLPSHPKFGGLSSARKNLADLERKKGEDDGSRARNDDRDTGDGVGRTVLADASGIETVVADASGGGGPRGGNGDDVVVTVVSIPDGGTVVEGRASAAAPRDFHAGDDYARIEISLKCCGLKNRDWLSKSDPFCVVHVTEDEEEEEGEEGDDDGNDDRGQATGRCLSPIPSPGSKELGRTEVIRDDLNPDFTRKFVTSFIFEEQQTLLVRVYDEDVLGDEDLTKHDYLGSTSVTLARLMGSRRNTVKLPLVRAKGKKTGHVIVQAEEVASCNDKLILRVDGSNLDDRVSGRSLKRGRLPDPFLVLSRMGPGGDYAAVWRSAVRRKCLAPEWEAELSLQKTCNGDLDRPVRFEMFDWEKVRAPTVVTSSIVAKSSSVFKSSDRSVPQSGTHKRMGTVHTTVRCLLDNPSLELSLDDADGRSLPNSSPRRLNVRLAEIRERPSMLEYTSGTCEIHFMAAVDFSSSNETGGSGVLNGLRLSGRSRNGGSRGGADGGTRSPGGLHAFDHRGFSNEYQAALSTIGSILVEYGASHRFPLYGFGAGIGGNAAHCFQVPEESPSPGEWDEFREEAGGLDAMLEAYKNVFSLPGFEPTEPTLLAPVVREATENALRSSESNEQAYTVLLILTDGKVNDVDQTIDELTRASDAPLSIVIVGVGGGDFADMERLDADTGEGLVSSWGEKCKRDLVQFVPFRKYSRSLSRLTAETLVEIPSQLVGYFSSKGIMPSPPVVVATAVE